MNTPVPNSGRKTRAPELEDPDEVEEVLELVALPPEAPPLVVDAAAVEEAAAEEEDVVDSVATLWAVMLPHFSAFLQLVWPSMSLG